MEHFLHARGSAFCFSEMVLLNARDNSGRKRCLAYTTEGVTESSIQTHRIGGKNPSLSGSRHISPTKVGGAVSHFFIQCLLALAWLRVIFRWWLNKCLNECMHQCRFRRLANAVTLGSRGSFQQTASLPSRPERTQGSFPPWIQGQPLKDSTGHPGEDASRQPWPGSWIVGC